MIIDCSVGETEALVTRAGRGAGLSWGQAQEAARAVARLGASGLPAMDWLAALLPIIEATSYDERCPQVMFDALTGEPAQRWVASGAGMCPVALGCSFGDALPCVSLHKHSAAYRSFEFASVWWPGLIAGFLMPVTSRLARSVRLEFNGGEGLISGGRLLWRGDWAQLSSKQAETVVATVYSQAVPDSLAEQSVNMNQMATRFQLADATYASLQQYAHKTYVQSTDAARAKGAGAGLTDND